jgi:hypothetical protein
MYPINHINHIISLWMGFLWLFALQFPQFYPAILDVPPWQPSNTSKSAPQCKASAL